MFSAVRMSFFTMLSIMAVLLPSTIWSQDIADADVLSSAIEKGKQCANYWVQRDPSSTNYYADICSFYGACLLGDALDDDSFYKTISGKYRRTTPISTKNIDENSCGILPLHLYTHNNNQQQLKLGIDAANSNMQKDGYVRNAIDDTYMTGSLHAQAYKATDDEKYLDFFADYMTMYMGRLQQSNGLYWHHRDISHQFWGRGNGWGAASSAELLRIIPEDHQKYDTFIDHYKKHMQGLVDAQLESGMWPQLLMSTDGRNWEESSGSSMFVFALFTGLEMGVLDTAKFLEPAKKGWMAVKDYLGSDGKLKNIAAGFWPSVGDANEYLNANRAENGNSHGTAGFLWAATSVVSYYNNVVGVKRQPSMAAPVVSRAVPTFATKSFDLKGRLQSFSENRYRPSASAGVIIRTNGSVSKAQIQAP